MEIHAIKCIRGEVVAVAAVCSAFDADHFSMRVASAQPSTLSAKSKSQ
jgi:hypothetical protein